MRIFVCELVSGGGLCGRTLPPDLSREGDIMLRALVGDLADLPDIEVVTTRDRRLPDPKLRAEIHWVGDGVDPWSLWCGLISDTDAAWPIAPETGGLLECLSELIVARRSTLIGSRPAALRLTSSKRRAAAHLAAHGVPAVQALPLDRALATELPPSGAGWVVKPDDGSGAEDTWRFDDVDGVRRWARGRNDAARFIVQPYVPGIASSLSLLCRGGRATLLTCNRQNVRLDGGRFRYCGGIVGAGEARRPEYAPIAERIAAAIGELWGYVGVDLIESESGPVVLEINARLTMSYVGLREALGVNPAALVLRMLTDAATPPPAPRPVRECKVAIDVNAA